MAALFAKRVPGGAPPLQQRNPEALVGQANSQLLQAPSYSPPQGQIYGTDPMLMRIAMQKQMFDQRQKQSALAEALRRGWESAKRSGAAEKEVYRASRFETARRRTL